MGWPILHNAHLCKDIGYYYDIFNLKEGSTTLENILENHGKHSEEYLIKNRRAIDRFLPTNIEVQTKYVTLIFNLFS